MWETGQATVNLFYQNNIGKTSDFRQLETLNLLILFAAIGYFRGFFVPIQD
jgi:hypothetical protein